MKELPDELLKEVSEVLARTEIERMVTEQLEERVAKGELERFTDEQGEVVYQRIDEPNG